MFLWAHFYTDIKTVQFITNYYSMSLPFWFSDQNSVHTFKFSYMIRPSHSPSIVRPNSVWWQVQIMCSKIRSMCVCEQKINFVSKTIICNVAYRHVAKRWLCKPRPFLGNRLINTFPLILNNATVVLQQWKRGTSTWSVPRCYEQGTKSVESWVLQERLRRDCAIVKLTLYLWSVSQRATAWPQKLKNLHC
jgi:hypothetical protein